jgi:epoxyqueuosine reductase
LHELAAALKARVLAEGFDLAGIAPATPPPHYSTYLEWLAAGMHGAMEYMQRQKHLRAHPESLLPGVRSIVVAAMNYARGPHPARPGLGRIAAYAWGRDYHKVLRAKLRRVATWLLEREPQAQSRICVDSAPLMERDYAALAGIGWFGKNSCIINTQRGSYFLFGCLLTTLSLPPDRPAEGGCGTCRLCLDACPTGAIVGPGVVDARRCISYLTIEKRGPIPEDLQPLMQDWVFGCDVCQDVCPFNHPRENAPLRGARTTDPKMSASVDPSPKLTELAELTEEEFVRRYAGTALMRSKHEGLVRNAHIALRNEKGA